MSKSKTLTIQDNFNIRDFIYIKGARGNNLKNVDVILPKNKLIVVTGVSGSGKSTITMDTLFAEGQRRYVESLSSYARQFLMRMKKPEVDYIKGICPAISVEQKVSTSNARSTVGSMTEIIDYLRLLYARIGKTYSPKSGLLVAKHEVSDVIRYLQSLPQNTSIGITSKIHLRKNQSLYELLDILIQKGYNRVISNSQVLKIDAIHDVAITSAMEEQDVYLLIDRIITEDEESIWNRAGDSTQQAFQEGKGECHIFDLNTFHKTDFNNRFELDDIEFIEPSVALFNYNNPFGACPTCEGYGQTIGIDEIKVIPDPNLSLFEEAVVCWRGDKGQFWKMAIINTAIKHDFPIHRAYKHLSEAEKDMLWEGTPYFEGINAYFKELESQSYKIQNRVLLSRFRGKTKCPTCKGKRLRKEAEYVKVFNKSFGDLVDLPIDELLYFFEKIELSSTDTQIASRILEEVNTRLRFLVKIGLGYLSLNRVSGSLSGGETQRINLTRTLGSNLTESMYILDEPSIGLHPKDSLKLIEVLKDLRNLGNTVIVVEHEEDMIRHADHILDMGPYAGIHGGEVIFNGSYDDMMKNGDSLTIDYLTEKKLIVFPKVRREGKKWIHIIGASQHNLKNINVDIPLKCLTAVCGVSGSGKTTLITKVLLPYLQSKFGQVNPENIGQHDEVKGDLKLITNVEFVNQNPIGKSSRSNPVTYVKAYDEIRKLFSEQHSSKIKGFQPKHFSFNVEGGRCESCQGEGETTVEMQFLADVKLECEECNGKKFKKDVLEVTYNNKNIFEVLNLTVDEALLFFANQKSITNKLQPLADVGLGYVSLGQSSSSLSGGEAQRVKLASFLTKEKAGESIFFVFDEPTTGLHFHDINKLMQSLQALVQNGHTVLVIEHNMDVIKCADWVIELGPDGGKNGGNLVFQGTPESLIKIENSHTAIHLQPKLINL